VRRTLVILSLLLAALSAAAPLAAQRGSDTPRRPALPAGADSNDARAYMQLAELRLTDRPRDAADAFYWAFQLNPTLSEALYGRYSALLLSNPTRLVNYWDGDRRTLRSPEVIAMDSLYFRALTMDPFLYRRFEATVFRTYLERWVRMDADASGGMSAPESEVQRAVSEYLLRAGPYTRAREAYSRGRFPDALRLYGDAIANTRRKSWLRAERARLQAHLRDYPAALTEMTQALEEMRHEDERDIVYLYESKELLEHAVGVLNERLGNRAAAREAYGRALTEQIAFYPAHVRLASLALAEGDTTTAVAEFDLAAQTSAEPSVMYTYGAVLAQIGRYDEAAEKFARASQLAPYYADPHFGLGMVRDAQGNGPAAVAAYQAFLDRATRGHTRRPHAEQRVAALAGGAQTTVAQTGVAP
jgi:tetratricopeptide (TPR) repeat protein